MFEVKRPEEKPIIVIRTATPHELSTYEKWKLENIEEGAQVNKLEMIRVETPSKKEAYASIDNTHTLFLFIFYQNPYSLSSDKAKHGGIHRRF